MPRRGVIGSNNTETQPIWAQVSHLASPLIYLVGIIPWRTGELFS